MQNFINKIFTALFLLSLTTAAQAAGTVYGYKFNDLNGNGVDNAEPKLENVKIVIQNSGGIPFMAQDLTDALGRYSFSNLPLQKYVVCEVLDPKWIATTPQCVLVELDSKDKNAMVVFGNKIRNIPDIGCTRTQGFWGSSPQGQALLKILVPGTMGLGTTNYTATQLDAILDTPVAGNALLILAHQLIAAKLNVLAGASNVVFTQIPNSDAAIGNFVIPPIGGGFVAPATPLGMNMTSLATDLDKFNNGLAGVPHCN